jgi:hypothetical protein
MMLSVILAIGFVLRRTDRLGNGTPVEDRQEDDGGGGQSGIS